MTDEDELVAVVRRALGQGHSRWTFSVQREDDGFTLFADHPASAGLVIATGTFDRDLAAGRVTSWLDKREIAVADAAPELVHPYTVAGVRNLTVAFNWPAVQVRSVAYLLYEAGALTTHEAGWLSGFVAEDAPMVDTPPV